MPRAVQMRLWWGEGSGTQRPATALRLAASHPGRDSGAGPGQTRAVTPGCSGASSASSSSKPSLEENSLTQTFRASKRLELLQDCLLR